MLKRILFGALALTALLLTADTASAVPHDTHDTLASVDTQQAYDVALTSSASVDAHFALFEHSAPDDAVLLLGPTAPESAGRDATVPRSKLAPGLSDSMLSATGAKGDDLRCTSGHATGSVVTPQRQRSLQPPRESRPLMSAFPTLASYGRHALRLHHLPAHAVT